MSYWSGVTRNLIMENSGPVRKHGGNLGMTTWTYVVGNDGVKTIEPALTFYLNPPPNSRCRWSTDDGCLPPNHIVFDGRVSENGMPSRELVDWNDDTVQSKVEQYRDRYWEELKFLVRPNTFEDLYDLFDSSTLWHNGAYNLWKLVNALVTLAHDEFPCVLQDWKNFLEQVVYETFRPIAGINLGRHNNVNNTANNNGYNNQILHNQHVLAGWDRVVDPLVLLQHTSFPFWNLPSMNIQQHGLLRELLICEHIMLTGTKSPIPQYYNYPRPVVHASPTPASELNGNEFPGDSDKNVAVRAELCRIVTQTAPHISTVKSKSALPLVVVGSNDCDGELEKQDRDVPLSKRSARSGTDAQSPDNTLSFPAPLTSIPEESTGTKNHQTQRPAASETASSPSKNGLIPQDIANAAPRGLIKPSDSLVDTSADAEPTHGQRQVPQTSMGVEVPMIETIATEAKAAVPKITVKDTKPPSHSPIANRKDSNGSIDELFFPNVSTQRFHVGRKRSIASAPDQDTDSMLTMAEKSALTVSETPPIKQAHCDLKQSSLHPASGAFIANVLNSQSFLRPPAPGDNQGKQRPEPMGYQTQSMPPFSARNGMLRGQAPFNQSPPNMRPDANGSFIPSSSNMQLGPTPPYGPPLPAGVSMPIDAPMNAQMRPPLGPPFQHQMPPHMNQQLLNRQNRVPGGYQANGYIHHHHPQQYNGSGGQGNSGYSSNGYRINNNDGFNSQYNGRRRDNVQSNGSRKNRVQPVPTSADNISRPPSAGFPGRRQASVARPDQSRARPGSSSCRNDTGLAYEDLFTAQFVECSCARCQESSRSVFVRIRPQDNMSKKDIQNAILKHFAQFNPVDARIRPGSREPTCFVQFQNDLDIPRIVHWSCNPQNQSPLGISDRIHTWYPLYSKHYVPEQRGMTQDRLQPHSLPEHNRRDSNPFRNQQPMDTSGIPSGIPYTATDISGSLAAPGFPPSNGIFYQQIPTHHQPRPLYNPKAPQRRNSRLQNAEQISLKTEQKLWTRTGYSQDVRRSLLSSEGSWRQTQAKLPSEEVVMEEKDNTMEEAKAGIDASSIETAKTSHAAEEVPAHQAVSIEESRSNSLDVDPEPQDTSEASKPQSGYSQNHGLRKEQGLDKPNEKERQMEPAKKERNSTEISKIAPGTNSDNTAAVTTVAASHTDCPSHPSQKANVSTDNLEADMGSVTGSNSAEIETTKPAQPDTTPKSHSRVVGGHGEESVASSRTMTPQTARSSEEEIATHNKSPVEKINPTEKQAGPAGSIETLEVDAINDNKARGGYSMTTSQLSSAVEEFGYSTGTVIRHKPVRPSLPSQWNDAEAGEEGHAGAQSSPARALTIDRFGDVERHVNVFHIRSIARISPEDMVQNIMTRDLGDVIGNALAKEATPSSATSVSNEDKTTDKGLRDLDTKSAIAMEQNSGPSRRRTKSKKKKKSQGARSQLTSRSETPIETQSRGPSPALEQSVSAATSDDILRKDSSTKLQNNQASFEGSSQPKKTKNKQSKKTKQPQLVTEVLEGQAKSGGSGDQKKQEDVSTSSLGKTEAPQGDRAEICATVASNTVANPRVPSVTNPDKASKPKFRSNTTGGSLRMPKNRSAKKGSQKSAPLDTIEREESATGEVPSLSSVFEPPIKEIKDAPLKTNASTDQKRIVGDASKPEASTNSLKLSRDIDHRVALPRFALPLQQVARSTKTGGSWASVAKGAVSQASKTDKINNNDPFTADKEQVALGDFIKAENLKSAQKAGEHKEKGVSRDKSSPTPSPEKYSRRQNATAKSQLNAAVRSFNPLASCTTPTTLAKQRLNPNAATFSLASSASQSVNSAQAPASDQSVAIEKPIVAEQQMPIPDRNSDKKRHAKTASLTGPTGKTEKRFITPAEQVLDATKVVQPPPPSKEGKRFGDLKETTEDIHATEQVKDVKKALETRTQVAGNTNAKAQSTTNETKYEIHAISAPKELNTDSFPTLDQAATVCQNKKRRHASNVKAGPSAPDSTARGSGTIVGSDSKTSSQGIGFKETQQNGGKVKQTNAQSSGVTQQGEKDIWQTVAPKQKTNGGSNKGHHGGRTGKYGYARTGRGGRGGCDGAMEERKGG